MLLVNFTDKNVLSTSGRAYIEQKSGSYNEQRLNSQIRIFICLIVTPTALQALLPTRFFKDYSLKSKTLRNPNLCLSEESQILLP